MPGRWIPIKNYAVFENESLRQMSSKNFLVRIIEQTVFHLEGVWDNQFGPQKYVAISVKDWKPLEVVRIQIHVLCSQNLGSLRAGSKAGISNHQDSSARPRQGDCIQTHEWLVWQHGFHTCQMRLECNTCAKAQTISLLQVKKTKAISQKFN